MTDPRSPKSRMGTWRSDKKDNIEELKRSRSAIDLTDNFKVLEDKKLKKVTLMKKKGSLPLHERM